METKFNKNFFAQWRKNRGLRQMDILTAINCTAYETIRNWDNGNLIPTNRIMELCEIYNIPVTNFFLTDGGQTYTEFFETRLADAIKTNCTHLLHYMERGIMDGTEAATVLKRAWEQFGNPNEMTDLTPTLPNGEGGEGGGSARVMQSIDRPAPTTEQLNPHYELEILKLKLQHAEERAAIERKYQEKMEAYRQLIRKEKEQTSIRNQEERMRMSGTIEALAQENSKLARIVSQSHHIIEHKTSTGTSTYMVMEDDPLNDKR